MGVAHLHNIVRQKVYLERKWTDIDNRSNDMAHLIFFVGQTLTILRDFQPRLSLAFGRHDSNQNSESCREKNAKIGSSINPVLIEQHLGRLLEDQ